LLRDVLVDGKSVPFIVWQAHAMLGRLYVDSRQYAKANQEFERGLQAIEEVRSDLLSSEFKITFLERLISFFQEYVDALVEQEQIVRALEVAEYSRARVLAERLGSGEEKIAALDARRFQAFARENRAAIVSYWLAPRRSFVWVIRPEGIRHAVLPPARDIAELGGVFRRLVEEELRDPIAVESAPVHRLAELLLSDSLKLIKPGSQVFVVPDGVLHRINLETLPVPGTNRYLLEEWSMSVTPSLSILAGEKKPLVRQPDRLLVVGNPEGQGPEFPALPKAGDEIRSIEKHFSGTAAEVYTGVKATPRIFRDSHPERFSLIHFAAHAVANPQSPLESAVILSRDGDQFKLYARDVTATNLRADLVTISACRSAGARAYSGEGLVGFAWAFLQAGSRAVIAGLWDVSDSSTAVLMDRLYEGIAGGAVPEKALRSAKLALLKSSGPFKKPYYWGPLQAYVRATSR
jgi:CHAT domain-containing protein